MRHYFWFGVISLTFTLALGACQSNSSPPGSNATLSRPTPPASGKEISSFKLGGVGKLSDGTPVASKTVQYELIVDGSHLFTAGVDGCLATPAHVAGTLIQDLDSDNQGQYDLEIPIHAIQAAVVRQCHVENLNAAQITGLTLRAQILADADTCSAFCSSRGDPSSNCVDNCSTGNRTLVATRSLGNAETQALLSSSNSSQVNWSGDLIFSDLGPALTPGAAPDLQVDGDSAQKTAHLSQESFEPSSCEVQESCVRGPGLRMVLRFDGTIQNLGSSDLVIGSPLDGGLFQQSTCHNVPLLKNIMLYELIDPNSGNTVQVDGQEIVGRKQGFCMMDTAQLNATAPQGQYDCSNQGITRGWADIYDSSLECQFLDVTGVPGGNYQLRLTVNPDGLFDESDTTNNSVEIPVTIPSSTGNTTP